MEAREPIENTESDPRRGSQMRLVCHFLDVFASADPVVRARALLYGERLREQGCDGEDVIRIAATTLLIAIENELEQRSMVLERLPSLWTRPA